MFLIDFPLTSDKLLFPPALPEDYDKSKAEMERRYQAQQTVFTTIPRPTDGDGSSEWIVKSPTKAKVLNEGPECPGVSSSHPKASSETCTKSDPHPTWALVSLPNVILTVASSFSPSALFSLLPPDTGQVHDLKSHLITLPCK